MARAVKPKDYPFKWRNSAQIRGNRAQLVAAVNCCRDGCIVELDITTARNLIEICLQAEHTEKAHGV